MEHQIELTADGLWGEVSERLRGALNEATFGTWFADAAGSELSDDAFTLAVPNDFTREWIEGHFLGLIRAAVKDATGHERRVRLTVVDNVTLPEHAFDDLEAPDRSAPVQAEGMIHKYTFDGFVIGSSNRFAHAAALAVAEAPAQAYNPLFIYGGTGLGKTHLLQAIGQYVGEHGNGLTARYVTSETFMNDFINSLRDKRIEGFKQRYRTYDVLLVDDVQFFEGKERIQEEFFHTFNSLYESGSQIVISSDRPPKEIATLEARLRSRFEWGLITDIQPPDLETRIAILRAKAEEGAVPITSDVVEFIARKVVSNIRELEGALNRIVAFSSMGATPISIELAQAVLSNVLYNPKKRQVTPERIARAVSDYYSVPMDALQGQKRDRAIVMPRQIAMFLMREETDVSLLRIGAELGGRDHSTVLHACDKITREVAVNDELRREIAAVRELIYAD